MDSLQRLTEPPRPLLSYLATCAVAVLAFLDAAAAFQPATGAVRGPWAPVYLMAAAAVLVACARAIWRGSARAALILTAVLGIDAAVAAGAGDLTLRGAVAATAVALLAAFASRADQGPAGRSA